MKGEEERKGTVEGEEKERRGAGDEGGGEEGEQEMKGEEGRRGQWRGRDGRGH